MTGDHRQVREEPAASHRAPHQNLARGDEEKTLCDGVRPLRVPHAGRPRPRRRSHTGIPIAALLMALQARVGCESDAFLASARSVRRREAGSAHNVIANDIHGFYNPTRRHAALGNLPSDDAARGLMAAQPIVPLLGVRLAGTRS